MNPGKRKVRVATLVWGEWYSNVFRDITLPTLLAPGNLPLLAKQTELEYLIATTPEDVSRLENAPAFRKLSKLAKIEFLTSPIESFQAKDGVSAQVHFWTQFYRRSRSDGSILAYVAPDTVFSEQAFTHSIELILRGSLYVVFPIIRIAQETALPRLNEEAKRQATQSPSVLKLSAGEVSSMILEHLHPINTTYIEGNPNCSYHCEHLYYPVPGEGFLLQNASCSVVGIDCAYGTLTNMHHPTTHGHTSYTTDTDIAVAASLAPLFQYSDMYTVSSPLSSDHFGQWLFNFFSQEQINLHKQKYRYSYGKMSEPAWQKAEAKAEEAIRSGVNNSVIQAIASALEQQSCSIFSSLMMTAFHRGGITGAWPFHEALTVLAPKDSVFTPALRAQLDDLLRKTDPAPLSDYVLSHFFRLNVRYDSETHALSFDIDSDRDVVDTGNNSVTLKSLSGKPLRFEFSGDTLKAGDLQMRPPSAEFPSGIKHILFESLLFPLPGLPHTETQPGMKGIPSQNILKSREKMPQHALPQNILETYILAQKFRQLGVLLQTCHYYADQTGLGTHYEPLNFLREKGIDSHDDEDSFSSRAVKLLEQILGREPDFAEAHLALGEILRKEGRADEALPHFIATINASRRIPWEKKIAIDMRARAAYFAALLLEKTGPEKALSFYNLAYSLSDYTFPQAHAGVARCMTAIGRGDVAREFFLDARGSKLFTPELPGLDFKTLSELLPPPPKKEHPAPTNSYTTASSL